MADKILFDEMAFKHGYTEGDIRCGIETQIYDGFLAGETGKYAIMMKQSGYFIAWNYAAK